MCRAARERIATRCPQKNENAADAGIRGGQKTIGTRGGFDDPRTIHVARLGKEFALRVVDVSGIGC